MEQQTAIPKFGATVVGLVLLAMTVLPAPVASAAAPCGDVQVIWARGSGVAIGSDAQFVQFYQSDIDPRIGPEVSLSSYQLGENGGFGGHAYPAAGTDSDIQDGFVFRRFPGPFWNSVDEGKAELVAYLTDRAAACPGEFYVLGGWSQGALVIGEGLFGVPLPVRDRIAQVALFGDPALETGNTDDVFGIPTPGWPAACWEGRRPWVRGSAPCWIGGGALGHRDPYVPADMTARVGSWCAALDGVCTGSLVDLALTTFGEGKAHRSYFLPNSWSAWAAHDTVIALQLYLPAKAASFDVTLFQFVEGATGADIAFVFDTTGSMWNEIANAKAEATNLAQQWLAFFDNGRVALIEYRDHGDLFVARVDAALTNDVTSFQAAVNGLAAGGGGDWPEALNSGLMTALNQLDWQDGAIKASVVITDAPGKDPEPITGFTRDQVVQRALEIDPVAIYGVNVDTDPNATSYLDPLANATAGEVLVVDTGETLADALFEVLDTVHLNPVAVLNGPYFAEPGNPILFSADGSFDADGSIDSFEWDFDADGTTDQVTSTSEVSHAYPGPFDGLATVRVISSDGGLGLASAEVTVNSIGLGGDLPVAVQSAAASVTGTGQVTVTWTPAPSDRAEGYKVYLGDGTPLGWRLTSDPSSLVVPNLDLGEPVIFKVVATNRYGNSAAASSSPVGGGAWSASVRVDDDQGTAQQQRPEVALGPAGAAYMVWEDYRSDSVGDIYFARRNAATGMWGSNLKINSDVGSQVQDWPAIDVDAAGDSYVVWHDGRNQGSIYFAMRSASTGTWSANTRVDDTQSHADQRPRIAVGSSGEAIVVWFDPRPMNWNVLAARRPAGSSTWGATLALSTGNAADAYPDVVIDGTGTAHAVWEKVEGALDMGIWYTSLLPTSSVWSNPVKVSDEPAGTNARFSRIGINDEGELVVSWMDWRDSTPQIRISRRPGGSTTWSPSESVSGSTTVVGSDSLPSLDVRPDGAAFVVWPGVAGDGQRLVWGSEYDPTTSDWSTPIVVSDDVPPALSIHPSVAFHDGVTVAWTSGPAFPGGDIRVRDR